MRFHGLQMQTFDQFDPLHYVSAVIGRPILKLKSKTQRNHLMNHVLVHA